MSKKQTATGEASFNTAENPGRRILTALIISPLSLFPLVALLTYDWRSIDALMIPPLPHTNWIGALGDNFAYHGYTLFGLAVWTVPAICVLSGIRFIRGRKVNTLRHNLCLLSTTLSLSCLFQVIGENGGVVAALSRLVNLQNAGGAVGYLVMTRMLSPLISDFASSIVMAIILISSLIGSIGTDNISAAIRNIWQWAMLKDHNPPSVPPQDTDPFKPENPIAQTFDSIRRAREEAKRQREEEKQRIREEKEREKERIKEEKERAREEKRTAKLREKIAPDNVAPEHSNSPVDKGPYELPQLSLLNPLKKSAADHGNVNETKRLLIDTLRIFGVDATLDYTVEGPVVTKYAISLSPGTRYSVVTSISDNLMGALRAKSLRIEAPIPGEDRVGIEIPNRSPAGISFREIIESDEWQGFKGALPLLFGKDAAGRNLVADLATMPHMLVAGATGQGKSVCLNAIINGLLMTKTPQELKFIMVDPKSVEFTPYASIPHLLAPVITDNNKAAGALRWAVVEMEKRLKLFARARVRNIKDFNSRPQFTQTNMFSDDESVGSDMPRTLPYIIIIIDEVADLMSVAAKEVIPYISRLTAKARAAGIHVILATQRPDAKVINGTIKANIPGRVAFKTATAIDSRTILDESGAESLIGRGDMLYKTSDSILIRAQGAWISDDEIQRITEFIEAHSSLQYDEGFTKKLGKIKETSLDDEDEENEEAKSESSVSDREKLKTENADNDFKKAVKCILETKRASISHFQRRLKWGYNHSASIIDMLEDAGVVSPQVGAGPRQIAMSEEELIALCNEQTPQPGEGGTENGDMEDDLLITEDQI